VEGGGVACVDQCSVDYRQIRGVGKCFARYCAGWLVFVATLQRLHGSSGGAIESAGVAVTVAHEMG